MFYRDHADLTLARTADWAQDVNFHVRRLASEGSRPRLPWGIRLTDFVKDPTPILPILEALKNDPTDYVRRSVANNLNDIAKDHPDLVATIARRWMKDATKNRSRLVKHACRSLIKSGHPSTLSVFGYSAPDDVAAQLNLSPDRLMLGKKLTVDLTLRRKSTEPLPVLIDLVVNFRKANGELSPKVFKWTEVILPGSKSLSLSKTLHLKPLTTRRHYSGTHSIAVQVNGVLLAERDLILDVPD